jgi:hypothetical protein
MTYSPVIGKVVNGVQWFGMGVGDRKEMLVSRYYCHT